MKKRKNILSEGAGARKKRKEGDGRSLETSLQFWETLSPELRSSFLCSVKTQISKRLRPKQFLSLEDREMQMVERKEGQDLLLQIEGTCVGLNNSFTMVYGAPGCGKTFFVNEITKQFVFQHQQQPTTNKQPSQIHMLSLNGKLHSNHKHSLQSLLLQISGQEKKNAATKSQLEKLRLTEEDGKGTYNDQTKHIIDILKKRKKKKEATILILDEFDLFVQGGQKMIYFLSDVQHESVSICIIAITSHQNILLGSEKRIRSRINPSLQLSLSSLSEKEVLTMMATLLTVIEKEDEWKSTLMEEEMVQFDQFVEAFNGSVESLFQSEEMKNALQSVYYRSRNLRTFCGMCVSAVSSLTPTAPFPSLSHFQPAFSSSSSLFTSSTLSSFFPCWKSTIQSFSEIEAVIVTIMFLLFQRNCQLCTFEQIFSSYGEEMGREGVEHTWGRGVIEKSFARLINCGVVVWVDERGKALRRCRLTLMESQLRRIPFLCGDLPETMNRWIRKSINQ